MAYKDSYDSLIFEKKGHVGYIKMNDPKTLNSMSYGMMDSLNMLLDDIKADRDVWGVILTGEGDRAFCAGANLKGGAGRGKSAFNDYFPLEQNRDFRLYIAYTFNHFKDFERPTIAAINGYALGAGAEIAACCDMRIASSNAKIGYPEVNVGGIAAYTGVTRAARILSNAACKEMLFTGKHYPAEDALRLGFISRVTEPGKVVEAAEEIMSDIVAKAPIAVKYTKIMIDRCLEMSYDASLEFERALVGITSESEDFVEGMQAFAEKRKPDFKNR